MPSKLGACLLSIVTAATCLNGIAAQAQSTGHSASQAATICYPLDFAALQNLGCNEEALHQIWTQVGYRQREVLANLMVRRYLKEHGTVPMEGTEEFSDFRDRRDVVAHATSHFAEYSKERMNACWDEMNRLGALAKTCGDEGKWDASQWKKYLSGSLKHAPSGNGASGQRPSGKNLF